MRPDARVHGGADAFGAARWDFSTCANAVGPCPGALAAVQRADATRYPDPEASAVRHAMAALHGVALWRVLPATSASEFIQRFTAVSARLWPGGVRVPAHGYGDYATAARACARAVVNEDEDQGAAATLRWFAAPSSPLGEDVPPPWAGAGECPSVLDAVYAPLRLSGEPSWIAQLLERCFVLHSPNKALGLCGVRGAYAIAPRSAGYDLERCCHALRAAAPSWPLSAQGDALLRSWASAATQAWLQCSHRSLGQWKQALQQALAARGFVIRPSVTPFFVVQPPRPIELARLRAQGVAVRDTASFGLPGGWRLSAQPPAAQQALLRAVDTLAP